MDEKKENMLHIAAQRAMAQNHSQSQISQQPSQEQPSQQESKPKPSDEADSALIVEAINRLRVAFPDNTRDFYLMLYERLKEAHFTRFELVRKVNNTIDTYPYAKLTIGAILKANINK